MSDNMRTFAANKPQRGNEYKMLSVIIADDHHLVAEGIAKLLHESRVAKVVAIVHDITETKEKIRSIQPQMLLLDVAMPDGDGIDAIKMFRESCPTMRILILTAYAESSVILRALHNGAEGYILKNTDTDELINGICIVADGEQYICKEAQAILSNTKEALPELTTREREILQLIVKGYTMKEIAKRLFLGFETVHSYTKSLRQKLGCSNTASLVRTAIERHLV